MAHVVGVPRRDPCQRCKLPVFLAERLTVGKKVYHRTCLKCARCGSQLTPGSFYETEVDDEYCCETCPDEEELAATSEAANTSSVQLRHEAPAETLTAPTTPSSRTVRSSIADRLAFFEQSNAGVTSTAADAKLLQKSVSDEEKTKSLKKMEAAAVATTSPYKMNSAFSSFLHDTIDGDNDEAASEGTSSAAADTATDTGRNEQMETSDDSDGEDDLSAEHQLPELPKTQPPTKTEMAADEQQQQQQEKKKFTATAQLQLTNNVAPVELVEPKVDEIDSEHTPGLTAASDVEVKEEAEQTATKKTEIKLQLTTVTIEPVVAAAPPSPPLPTTTETTTATTNDNIINNNNKHAVPTEEGPAEAANLTTPTTMQDDVEIVELESRKPNDNNYVTKEEEEETVDAADAAQQMSTRASSVGTSADGVTPMETEQPSPEHAGAGEDQAELRTRAKETHAVSRDEHQTDHVDEDVETTKRLSVVRARLHQFEEIANTVPDLDKEDNLVKDKDSPSSSSIDKLDVVTEKNPEDVEKLKAIVENSNHRESDESPKQVPTIDVEESREETKDNENVGIKKIIIPMELEEDKEDKEKKKEEKEGEKQLQEMSGMPEDVQPKAVPTVDEEKPKNSAAKVEAKEAEENCIIGDHAAAPTPVDKPKEETVVRDEQGHAADPSKLTAATASKMQLEEYPEDLNPFKSDDEADEAKSEANKENQNVRTSERKSTQPGSLNPFDSSDDEIELEKSGISSTSTPSARVPPPRPPPPRISRNPFGDEIEDEMNFSRRSSLNSSLTRKTPVPTPRTHLSQSQNPTPEPTPRLSNKSHTHTHTQAPTSHASPALHNSSEYYGSANSLSTPQSLYRNSDIRGSNNSLTSSAGGTIRARKQRRAPAPPPPPVKELFPATETADSSKASTPCSSTVGTPKQGRKKRHAPAPPKPARLDPALLPTINVQPTHDLHTAPKNSLSYPLQSELDSKLSDEEKALLEGKLQQRHQLVAPDDDDDGGEQLSISQRNSRRMIPLDASLLLDDEGGKCDDLKYREHEEELHVVYRRVIMPPQLDTPTHDANPLLELLNESHDRQLEKLKDNKEAKNRNRQSQISASSGAEDSDPTLYNKSAHGKWKRRKGPAPALPIPPRKVLQMLPLQEIKHELEIIEVQQQGLEKQGVVLEKMIRDRCEGENGEPLNSSGGCVDASDGGGRSLTENSKEVEDLILQLFELVNEKNELFRRQAELMYLRRQHRLEQEQADLEYEIRVLMAQPERNKTDSDKSREEVLIARLVEVVQLRNEVIECLEMDRLREAEEDMSIKKRLELHTAQREGDDESICKSATKLSKKEKKKQKESKKSGKCKKLDADKDADESELHNDKLKAKKKKKKFIF